MVVPILVAVSLMGVSVSVKQNAAMVAHLSMSERAATTAMKILGTMCATKANVLGSLARVRNKMSAVVASQ